jgi:hypothetical protein
MKRPKRNEIYRVVCLPDLHVPDHDARSLAAVNKFIQENGPWELLIYLGDVLDMNSISSHNINNLRAVEGQRLLADYRIADEQVIKPHEQIIRGANSAARIAWLEGNHEQRVERYVDANPQLQGLIEPEIVLRLKERKIDYIRYWSRGDVLRIGKATFIHGRYINDGHPKKHALAYGSDVFYGHVHDLACYSVTTHGETYLAQSLGCLCLKPSWMQGRPDKWQQAFAVFEFMPDGEFGYSIIRIKNHRFVFGGKIYG